MSKPQVTITLGRTGRRVVRSEQVQSDRSWTDSQPLSGGKRSPGERVRNGADGSLLPTNKRLRNDFGAYGPVYNRVHDARIGQNDLRLKLMRKRRQSEFQERKKMTLRDKVSRNVRSTKRDLLRQAFHTKRAGATLHGESSRKSYAFHNGAALKPRSTERVPRLPREISPATHIDEPWQVPSRRPSDVSRTRRILDSDASRTTGPMRVTTRAPYDVVKPVTAPPPASGLPNTSYVGEKHHTVSALLHSLGLERYAITFQAEEVDIVALKQMRDNDLKELGIPMKWNLSRDEVGPEARVVVDLLNCSIGSCQLRKPQIKGSPFAWTARKFFSRLSSVRQYCSANSINLPLNDVGSSIWIQLLKLALLTTMSHLLASSLYYSTLSLF